MASQKMKRSSRFVPHPDPAWSSLPNDIIHRLAQLFLAADDLDTYMYFRAVYHSWRSATADPRADSTDPRFHPKNWAMLKKSDKPNGDALFSFVNLSTGRFLSKNIPALGNYFLVAATDGGLLVLAELVPPHGGGACVLNPFTLSVVARISVPILGYEVRNVAVTTSPVMMLFISGLRNNFVGCADLNSEWFNLFWPQHLEVLVNMTPFAGGVYMTNRHGSILSLISTVAVADLQEPSAATFRMTTKIPGSVEGLGASYYLVESAGDLLLVSFRQRAASEAGLVVVVDKVDTVKGLLEPMESIGGRAIFVSQTRSISVDATMLPTIEAGCIYSVHQVLTSSNENGVIISSHRPGHQRHQTIIEWGEGSRRGHFGPSTLVQVLGEYCMFIPTFEQNMLAA
jgi:hypothetical protein